MNGDVIITALCVFFVANEKALKLISACVCALVNQGYSYSYFRISLTYDTAVTEE